MAFHVHISDADRAYLDGLPLSPEAKNRTSEFVGNLGNGFLDEFRLDPDNRPDPDRPYFRIQHVFLDRWGDGRMHVIDFHIKDDGARFGVLLIVYIEHRTLPARPGRV